jgi:serine/threonine protein phosphatase PrpC
MQTIPPATTDVLPASVATLAPMEPPAPATIEITGASDITEASTQPESPAIETPAAPPSATEPDIAEAETAIETPAAPASPSAESANGHWADVDTVESPVVAAGAEDDRPWPLAVGTIVGERWRVEELLSAGGDDPDAENIYRASDLKGYESCWSCGTHPEASAQPEQFCPSCGADMMSGVYTMIERRVLATPPVATDELPTRVRKAAAGRQRPGDPAYSIEAASARVKAYEQLKTAPPAPDGSSSMRVVIEGGRVYRVMPRADDLPAFPNGARYVSGAASDIGLRKTDHNEDSIALAQLDVVNDSQHQALGLFAVADGLGGHVNGQDASRLVARLLITDVLRAVALPAVDLAAAADPTPDQLKSALHDAARAANAALCEANDKAGADMGSTLVAALLFGDTAYLINAGDSRAYVFDGGELRRITTDHSLVEQLVAGGFIEPEERYTHPNRNQIFRSLGDDPDLKFDLFEQKLRPGMRLLLCCDGLWEMVRDDEIARILTNTPNPQDACDQLITAANANGGDDNISAIVIEIHG